MTFGQRKWRRGLLVVSATGIVALFLAPLGSTGIRAAKDGLPPGRSACVNSPYSACYRTPNTSITLTPATIVPYADPRCQLDATGFLGSGTEIASWQLPDDLSPAAAAKASILVYDTSGKYGVVGVGTNSVAFLGPDGSTWYWQFNGKLVESGGKLTYRLRMSECANEHYANWPTLTRTFYLEAYYDTSVKVDRLTFSYKDIIARATEASKSEAQDLGRQREQVDATLAQAGERAKKAIEADAALQAPLAAVRAQFQLTQDTLKRLSATTVTPPADAQGLINNRDSLESAIDDLELQILAGRRIGADVRPLLAGVGAKRNLLVNMDKLVAAKLRGSPVGDLQEKWTASVRALRTKLFELRDKQAQIEYERTSAEATLRVALQRRAELDRRLMEIAQSLAGLDFDLREIKIEANGAVVFDAVNKVSLKELDALNQRLTELDTALVGLDNERQAAKKSFLTAGYAASARLDALAKLITRQAYEKFGVDFALSLYDVFYKGAGKGGLVGAVTETLKKVVEFGAERVSPELPGNDIDPTSIEAEVAREYAAD